MNFCVLIVTVSAACNAGVSDNERVSKYIKLANIKVKESYSVVLENGPKENDRQLEGESKDSKNKIHIFETRKATYLDSATYFLDSALSISSNRADVWIGKTQIAALYNSCKYQTQSFESLIKYFKLHPNEMILSDGSKISSIDNEIKNELMYAINRRWEAQEDTCNLELSHLLVNTFPEYVPGLNALAGVQAMFRNDSSWMNYEKAIRINPKDDLVVNNYLNQLIAARKCDKVKSEYLIFKKSGIKFHQETRERLKICNLD